MLLANNRLRRRWAAMARVRKTEYRWDVIMQKYEGLMAALKG